MRLTSKGSGAEKFTVNIVIDPKLDKSSAVPLFAKKHEEAKKRLANLKPKQ